MSVTEFVRKAFLLPVFFYKRCISPMLPPVCRFTPSCSQYMVDAVMKHGVIKGAWLGLRRICRCRPGGGCGYDPVPDKYSWWGVPESENKNN